MFDIVKNFISTEKARKGIACHNVPRDVLGKKIVPLQTKCQDFNELFDDEIRIYAALTRFWTVGLETFDPSILFLFPVVEGRCFASFFKC